MNCDYFDIERSQDAISFEPITKLKGSGNSNSLQDYVYLDKNFKAGKNYYRFKQVDFTGEFSYSNIVMVNNDESKNTVFELFPNPAKNILTVFVESKNNKTTSVRISNAFGQTLKEIVIANNQQNIIDVSAFSNGVYFATIFSNDEMQTKSFIKE